MMTSIYIGLGAAIGGILRHHAIGAFKYLKVPPYFGVFFVNVVGCFVIGLLLESSIQDPKLRQGLTVGLLGGFTTFSSFAADFANLSSKNQIPTAILYVLFSVATGIACFYLGSNLAKNL